MSALICGSFAYDHIMVFNDYFKNHILPDKIHILNVSFMVPDLHLEFGGCAGNMAYNLVQLGADPVPMGTVGTDFGLYADWLDSCAICRDHVKEIDGSMTAQAFITTDMDDNQITAFHPGAMESSHENAVSDVSGVKLGIIAPDGRQGMITHAEQFAEGGTPFIFDPGQGMPMFGKEELLRFIDLATWVVVNDYEWQLMQDRTGLSAESIAERVKALIVTRGSHGSHIYADGVMHEIPAAKIATAVDPTGCGDAYRAGLIFGLNNDLDWQLTGRIASLMGGIKIESRGNQNHKFTLDEFKTRFKESFSIEF